MDVRYVNLDLTPHLRDVAKELNIINGIPFAIGDHFEYDPVINAFLRSLASPSTPSPNTWKSYSEQISLFFRFMEANDKSWLEASKDDVRNYYKARRHSPSLHKKNEKPISTQTWNLTVTALIKLYEWAFEEGLIEKIPFTRTHTHTWRKGKVAEKERSHRKQIESIRLDLYKNKFRPALAQSRNSLRDESLADFLLTTGCRLSEALSIDIEHLPNPDADNFKGLLSVTMKITGKGNKRRTIKIPKKIVRKIKVYEREDRADVVDRWCYRNPDVKPSSKKYPRKVWLSERGSPLSPSSVDDFFNKASRRCGMKVYPHMLRHTYAVYQLSALVRNNINEARNEPSIKRLLRDPLRTLQRLMGHSRIETTYNYLDYLEEEEAYIESSLIWTDEVCEADV